MPNHDLTTQYANLINKNQYNFYFTITFSERINVDEDSQIKKFLLKLHRHLFGKRFNEHNLFLDFVLIRESHISNSNDHFHGLISTFAHDISFSRLIKAFVYANNKLHLTFYANKQIRTTTHIYNWNVPEFTFNHFQEKYTVDPYDYSKTYSPELLNILPKNKVLELLINSEDHNFPHNLRPIESRNDQQSIINYILKDTWKNTDHVAFLQPTNNDYFNFSTKPE